jgi:hypothetical protein
LYVDVVEPLVVVESPLSEAEDSRREAPEKKKGEEGRR